jgi:hypothetical protein
MRRSFDKEAIIVCRYCRGKIVRGEFPWILSRIEQDEAYRG